MNIYTVYEINKNYNISSYRTLVNCLLGAAELKKYILDMVSDWIEKDFFHLVMELVEM